MSAEKLIPPCCAGVLELGLYRLQHWLGLVTVQGDRAYCLRAMPCYHGYAVSLASRYVSGTPHHTNLQAFGNVFTSPLNVQWFISSSLYLVVCYSSL